MLPLAVILDLIGVHRSQYGSSASGLVNGAFLAVVVVPQTFRIPQAVPGGILPVVTMTPLYRIVPPEKIGAAMGYGLGVVVAPAVGPPWVVT